MPDKEQVLRLVDADTAVQTRIREQLLAQIRQRVAQFTGWYDAAQVTAFSTAIGNLVLAGERQAAAATAAYTARSATALGFDILRTVAVDLPGTPLRQGVTSMGQVYSRLASTVRYEVSQGSALRDAVDTAVNRADAMVQTDLQLARRFTSRSTLQRTNAHRYRRIIRPEASESGTCGLCAVAADRVYSKSVLMPIHDRCKCTVLPAGDAQEFALDLNRDELERVYGATGVSRDFGATYAENLLNVRVRVVEHGELGPVLVNANHRTRILDAA